MLRQESSKAFVSRVSEMNRAVLVDVNRADTPLPKVESVSGTICQAHPPAVEVVRVQFHHMDA